jgi:F-type H+-transporting ATPase subunit b
LDINLTLIVQMAVFAAFVLFTMRFVWPPLSKAMEERQNKIASGLSAAERARKELELAQHRAKEEIRHARVQSSEIIEKAMKQATSIVEEARQEAKIEALKQLKLGKDQLQQEINHAREALKKQVAGLAVSCAERILKREVDSESNKALLDDFISEI